MDMEPTFHQCLDHRAVRHLDGHADRLRFGARRRQYPIAHRAEAFATMREGALAGDGAMGIHQDHLMNLGRPVDAGEPSYVVSHGSLLSGSLLCQSAGHHDGGRSLYWRSRARTPHRAFIVANLPGHMSPPGARGTGGEGWLPEG